MNAKSTKLIIGVSLIALLGVVIIFGVAYAVSKVAKRTVLKPYLIASYHSKARDALTSTNWDEAIAYLDAAIALNRFDSWAYTGHGHAYGMKGDHKRAMEDFSQAIKLDASNPWPYAFRGKDYFLQHEWDHALADYDRAIRLSIKKQHDADAYVTVLEYRSTLYAQKNEWSKVLDDMNQAVQFKPEDWRLYGNRASALEHLERYAEVITNLNIELKLNPTNAITYGQIGWYQSRQGDYKKAIDAYAAGMKLQPDNAVFLNSFAWFLSTCPDGQYRNGKEAVAKAKKSCELSDWKKWYSVGTLAAAYAETGDFENAIKYQKQTLTMEGLTEKERGDANDQLKLYEAHKPYHEAPVKKSID